MMADLPAENENIEGSVKLEWDDTGEVRRWPARILKDYVPFKPGAPQDLLALIQGTFGMPTLECMTYIDNEDDVIFVSTGWHSESLDLKMALEYLHTQKDKCLYLKLHTTKDAALEYAMKIKKKQKKNKLNFETSELGTRPGLVVALDLGVPIREARELVRRATNGDEIAIRVVAPSRNYFKKLQATNSLDVLYNMQKFAQAHRNRTSAKNVPSATKPLPSGPQHRRHSLGAHIAIVQQSPACHWGIVCDGCEQSPIIGTRWHLKGKDYDLCDADYRKLCKKEQAMYEEIKQPSANLRRVCRMQKPDDTTNSGLDETSTQSAEQQPVQSPAASTDNDFKKAMNMPEVTDDDDEKVEKISTSTDTVEMRKSEPPPPYEEPVVHCNEPDSESVDDLVFITSNNTSLQSSPPSTTSVPPSYADTDLDHALDISLLTSMGFQNDDASRVLRREGSVEKAVESLIQNKKTHLDK